MDKIKMVDLHGQYLRIKDELDSAIQGVIGSTAFIRGGDVRLFQEELSEYIGVDHTIACGNGTDALQVALMSLNLKPGDEVITTPFTFIATVEVVRLLGLKPVFVDVLPDTFNLDPSLLDGALSDRTRAIIPVHLFGQCAHMEAIMDFASAHNLFVIEDNAQALGADYLSGTSRQKAGTLGHMATTSFFPSKNLGAFGDGGAIFTRDPALGAMAASLVNHGMGKRYHYEHVGVNSRLDTLQAAILRVKLRHLDDYHRRRQEAAGWYDEAFRDIPGVIVPHRSDFSTHIYHQYTLQLPSSQRDELRQWLQEKEIPSMIYYPGPLHLQKAYRDPGYKEGDLPVAEDLCSKVLSLPMHTELKKEQLEYISESLQAFFKS